MGVRSSRLSGDAEKVTAAYSAAKEDSIQLQNAIVQDASIDRFAPHDTQDSHDRLLYLQQRQKEGAGTRIAAKAGVAGVLGLLVGPIAYPPIARSAVLTACTAALTAGSVVAFHEGAREALTAATLVDTPVNSVIAGALTGYIWNGLMHQTRRHAVAGAVLVGGIAGFAHALLPRFAADKALASAALGAGLLDDPRGDVAAFVASPPVLPAWSWPTRRGWAETFLPYLPVKQISDEEYRQLQERNRAVTIRLDTRDEDGYSGGRADADRRK